MPTAMLAGLDRAEPITELGTDDTRLRNWALFHAARAGDRVTLLAGEGDARRARDYLVRSAPYALLLTDLAGRPAGRLALRPSISWRYFEKNPTHYLPGLDKDLELIDHPGPTFNPVLGRLTTSHRRKAVNARRDYNLDPGYSAAQAILGLRKLVDRLPKSPASSTSEATRTHLTAGPST